MQPNDTPPAVVDDEPEIEPEGEVAEPSAWQRLRRLFRRETRLYNLNWAISAFPDAPANYVLRGELLLDLGDTVGAAADFRRALELAVAEVGAEDWGLIAQALQDRALVGLRDALLRSARYNRATSHVENH